MLRHHWKRALQSGLVAGFAALVGLGAVATGPALADISRSCTGTLYIDVVGDGEDLRYDFTIPVTVASRIYANRARERSREAIISCVREHWDMRMSDGRPHWCDQGGNYPFQGFSESMTDAICAANPGRQSFLVNVSVGVAGNTGCVPNNQWAPIRIADDHRVYCQIAPQPEVRQGWNLPRQDYNWFAMSAGARWQQCQAFCDRQDRCQAWTYKHPSGDDPPLCFLKDGVPAWNRDDRFVSGVKGEVLH